MFLFLRLAHTNNPTLLLTFHITHKSYIDSNLNAGQFEICAKTIAGSESPKSQIRTCPRVKSLGDRSLALQPRLIGYAKRFEARYVMKAAEVEETWAALPDAARTLCQDQFKALHKSAMASLLHDQSTFPIS